MLPRTFLVFICAVLTAGTAHTASYPIKADDGTLIANLIVPIKTGEEIAALPNVVTIGNPNGNVTLFEFYDLNCPYCRKAAADIHALIDADKNLRVTLVPFPVLGVPSIQAGRVEFALARMATPEQFRQFNQKIFSGRGVIDGERALAVAQELGFKREALIEAANADAIVDAMKAHVHMGDTLQMRATPSLVIGDVAIIGYPGRKTLERVIRSVRSCGKAVC